MPDVQKAVLGLQSGADVLFLLVGAVLVFAMHGGFAFLEAGTVRHKNQVNALCKILVDFAISTVSYFVIGYTIAYGVSFFISATPPGKGAQLHRHPYEEVFVVQSGTLTFTVGEEQVEVGGGKVVIVPAGTWYGFTNTGSDVAHHVDIHVNGQMSSEWKET